LNSDPHLRYQFRALIVHPGTESLGYPAGTFVSATITKPFRGRIVMPEPGTSGRILWECKHERRSIPEAFQCAGDEAGRNGIT
jgi:hypothetical protein